MKRIITIIVALVAMASGTEVMAAVKEAYAVYTPTDKTLTFYYDTQKSTHTGSGVVAYSMPEDGNVPGWYGLRLENPQFEKVVFTASFKDYRPTSTNSWFHGHQALVLITNIKNLNTAEVTDMHDMFNDCSSLTSLDLSQFDTSKVTDMRSMFYGCSSLTSLDLSNFDTSKVTNMRTMFYGCNSLTSLDLSHFDTSNVTNMTFMFDGCSSLKSLDLSYFDTSEVTNMLSMFYKCSSLTSLDLSNFDTSKVTDMSTMFDGCSSLTSLDLSHFDTSSVTNMRLMFDDCSRLTSLDVSNFDTSNVTDIDYMFCGCSSLTSLDLTNFDTSNVTDMGAMFWKCSNLTTIYVGNGWTTSKVKDSYYMFYNCTAIKGEQGTTYDASHTDASYAHIDGGTDNPGYFTRGTHAYAVSDNGILSFYYDNKRNVRTGTTYDVVRGEQAWMDVRNSITKVVFDESFREARPTSTFSWFRSMSALTEITGIENLNTSEVDNMENMFFECTKLTSLDLSSFNTEKVTGMKFMFYGCSNLTSLDLSSFNTRNVTTMGSMFSECCRLETIYAGSGWSTDALKINSAMFTNCASLVGGQGTPFSSSHIGKEYAHIDGGSSNPGYFTGVQGVVTGIGEAFNGEASPLNDNGEMINDKGGEWYSLDGRRVLSPQKGHIYIRGGKKVVF